MIQLAKPSISEDAIKRVSEVLRSGNLVQGKYVLEFEQKLTKYLEAENAIIVSSGTAALHLSLLSVNIGLGDEVIIPAFTYPATANVVEIVGAKPVFVDITLADFCIDVSKIEAAITDRTKAIMPVHEFGQAADMEPIMAIAKQYDLKIIEDAACALGSEYKGKKAGTFGNMGCFSFHPRKAITTGEGGAIITNDASLAKKVRALRNHGMEFENSKLEFNYAGYNYRMTDFQAVLGIYQLDNFDKQISIRTKLANYYDQLLKDIDWIITPKVFNHRKMTYQTYHIVIKDYINRDVLIQYLISNKIQANYGAQAVNVQKYYFDKYSVSIGKMPNAYRAYTKGIALPIGGFLTKNEIKYICNIIKNYE
jgi:perosamine synthetase